MNCVSCDICGYQLGLFVFFPRVFLSSRVTGACAVTTDLIMRVNVRTTTTTIAWVRVRVIELVSMIEKTQYKFKTPAIPAVPTRSP